LVQLDALDCSSGDMAIVVPPSFRPTVDRILSDLMANLDARPWLQDGEWYRWTDNPVIWMERHV
jgi:hypothetical protein